tara:strand:- start:10 stop:216 length:207 start_codon:yes stop_codon:yes gene_type:complete
MFTEEELSVLRNSLNIIEIQGSNAKFLASLQIKIENEFEKIVNLRKEKEEKAAKEKLDTLPKEFNKKI